MSRHPAVLAFLCLCSCFRGLDAVGGQTAPPSPLQLEVGDQNASVWDADNAPRSPVFKLRADGPVAMQASDHLFLLRGTPSEDTLIDLASNTLRNATTQQAIALRIDAASGPAEDTHVIQAVPVSPLEPAARYTLVWSLTEGSQTFALHVSDSPAAGARLAQSVPAELDARVPPNLQRALLRFDGYLEAAPELGVQLRDGRGFELPTRVSLVACQQLDLPVGDCVELAPEQALQPSERYAISLRAGLRDITGAALSAQEISFRTGPEPDALAPEWLKSDCAKDEQLSPPACVMAGAEGVTLRVRASESGMASLACGNARSAALGNGGDFTLTLGLEAPTQCLLTLTDLAGNGTVTALALAPAHDLAQLSISEVRADPLGPEPSQEFVELLNFGDDSVSIEGFTLTTDPFSQGLRIVSALSLAPGERVLVVAPDFDLAEPSDGALPGGVRIARLERALSLRNEGAALYLRDAAGRRLSAAPALAVAQAGQCIVRVDDDPRTGVVRAFVPTSGGCTPGFADPAP